MAKEVTVLGLEGAFLRGVRLEEKGGGFVRAAAGSWPLADGTSAPSESLPGDAAEGGGDGSAPTAEIVEEDRPLARAFRAAASFFGRREFSISVPLSRMLVRCLRLPTEARDDLLGAAALELDGISPFPDEALAPAAEVVAETDRELTVVIAALPAAASEEISAALAAAKILVTRTDVTALGWLRTLWPRLCETDVRRRVALLRFGDGWDLAVLDDGVLTTLRGLGELATSAELVREVTLTLLDSESAETEVGEVVVCSVTPVESATLERLSAFGPVRTVSVEDPMGGAEGCARREVEGGAFDATPADWSEARTESRFARRLTAFLAVTVGVWIAVMGVLFGVDLVYDMMRDRQKALQKEKAHVRAFRDVSAMTNRVALIERYSDRAHSALEMLKLVTDCLPNSDDMTFRSFRYVRGESVRVQGGARRREDLRSFIESLEGSVERDNDEQRVFESVNQSGGETETKSGLRFAIDAVFPADSDWTRRSK